MNKTGIDWCDFSFNPITGCKHLCPYCYARKLSETRLRDKMPFGFEPTYYPDRLKQKPPRKPSKIFVGSMGDLFGKWDWREYSNISFDSIYVIKEILHYCKQYPQHTFIFLTKNPDGMLDYEFPDNCCAGVTVTKTEDLWRMKTLSKVRCKTKFISFEPLLEAIRFDSDQDLLKYNINWAILGSLSGSKNKCDLITAIDWLISECANNNVQLFIKDSIYKLYPNTPIYKEFPGGV